MLLYHFPLGVGRNPDVFFGMLITSLYSPNSLANLTTSQVSFATPRQTQHLSTGQARHKHSIPKVLFIRKGASLLLSCLRKALKTLFTKAEKLPQELEAITTSGCLFGAERASSVGSAARQS